jgi:hypothetical protein
MDMATINSSPEYQSWHLRVELLIKQAADAKEKGQWKKAQDLLFEARKIARVFQLNRE